MTDQNRPPFDDSFFSPIGNTKPYFKAAFEGFAGSGKTHTAAQVAIGLHQRIKSTKPVIIFDTEMASKYLKPMFEDAGIQVLVRESRSLADLKKTMELCRQGASDVLLIDSVSHVWENFLQSYMESKHRTRLEFQDWGVIKPTWKKEFSDPLVRDPYHIIFTGRAGYEYENEVNKETGKREVYKSGIKMKVEGETAYEPDMLVCMERFEEILGADKQVYREATIVKDRSTLIDGKTFKNPNYESFAPVIEALLKDPIRKPSPIEENAADLIANEEDRREWTRRRDIALEKIEANLTIVWPSTSAAEKKNKLDALQFAYGSMSWTEIGRMKPEILEEGLKKIDEFVKMWLESQRVKKEEAAPEDSAAAAGMKKGLKEARVS